MAMQPQDFSLSGLAVELGMDRRTLARKLADLPPASTSGRGKRWRLKAVLEHLQRQATAEPRSDPNATDVERYLREDPELKEVLDDFAKKVLVQFLSQGADVFALHYCNFIREDHPRKSKTAVVREWQTAYFSLVRAMESHLGEENLEFEMPEFWLKRDAPERLDTDEGAKFVLTASELAQQYWSSKWFDPRLERTSTASRKAHQLSSV